MPEKNMFAAWAKKNNGNTNTSRKLRSGKGATVTALKKSPRAPS